VSDREGLLAKVWGSFAPLKLNPYKVVGHILISSNRRMSTKESVEK